MKTYVIVGAGGRARYMFAQPLVTELKHFAKLAGICDINSHRARRMAEECNRIPAYTDFDRMLRECRPDVVIVTTVDSTHHDYIIRSLEAGCDVISEKPITTDAVKCRAILEAERRTGRSVTVTFNCRFMPFVAKIKEQLRSGVIGTVKSVQMQYMLDRTHGADYFRRWHRTMECSGGLLVHKSTHHFDMVNWWVDDEPSTVYANGDTFFYGPNRAAHGERCLTCEHQHRCEFYLDIARDDFMRTYYLEAEHEDGYFRDRCIFSENIGIYDTMSVNVKYAGGAHFSYTLTTYNPYEGWKVSFVGDEGRMEAETFYSGENASDHADTLKIYLNDRTLQIDCRKSGGTHGGGDEKLRRLLFVGDIPDPHGQQAGSRAGAMSMLIGAAANISIAEQRQVKIAELLG